MRIIRMQITGFKSIRSREIMFDGNDIMIIGQNGTGKTTVADAYFWAMTGKLSNGKTGNIKRLDKSGKPVLGEEHFVEVEFDDNTVFRRELTESGNSDTSSYYIDGVPMRERDYNEAVRRLVPEGLFPVLSNLYGATSLSWQELRELLIKVAGDITNEDALSHTEGFDDLTPYLKKFTVADTISVLKEEIRRRRVQTEYAASAIAENQHALDAIIGDEDELKAEIDTLTRVYNSKLDALTISGKDNTETIERVKAEISHSEELRDHLEETVNNLADLRDKLKAERDSWLHKDTQTCPVCEQPMQFVTFNLYKKRKLQELATSIDDIEDLIVRNCADLNKYELSIINKQVTVKELQRTVAKAPPKEVVAECRALMEKVTDAEVKLKDLQRKESITARINELNEEIRVVSADITAKEGLLKKAGQFQLIKARLLEDKINGKFGNVRFRLYDYYKNGVIKPCCEAVWVSTGVVYSQLSCGEQHRASAAILDGLQKCYSVELPIFIDESERFTSNCQIDLPNQKIRLVATEGAKELKVMRGW